MIDHMSLPVGDYASARAFYDACLGALGYARVREVADDPDDVWCGYGLGPESRSAKFVRRLRALPAGAA